MRGTRQHTSTALFSEEGRPNPRGESLSTRYAPRRSVLANSFAVIFLGVTILAGLVGCGGGQPTPPPPAEPIAAQPPPPPPPKPISIAEISPVVIDPGETKSVELHVDRAGNEGAITLSITEAPEGVTVKTGGILEGESKARLEISASEKLGDEELKGNLKIVASLGDLSAERSLALTVRKIDLPSFAPVKDVVLIPGIPQTVELKVDRRGFGKVIPLKLEGMPAGITATISELPPGKDATAIQFQAAVDAPEAQISARVVTTVLGRQIEQPVNIRVDRTPFRLQSFRVVTLKPGERQQIRIPVERRTYQGTIRITVERLPSGVQSEPVEVPAGQTEAYLELVANANAREEVASAAVIGWAGEFHRSDPLVVRVSLGESGFLPREIVMDPNLAPLLRRGSFGGRLTAESKEALMRAYGGTSESFEAILRGLRWLSRHQARDGRWSLKAYHEALPNCDCWDEFEKDVVNEDVAGTAFGLLPFLGEGITHNRSPDRPSELVDYKRVVQRGLEFLVRNQVQDLKSKDAGRLSGNMYAHAFGTMALCEAYGLSQDERLKVPAQLAIKYLMEAQHSEGGWRYGPKQPGDLSVTSWVFFAIRSGQLAGLMISKDPLIRAQRFVDSCAIGPAEARRIRYCYDPRAENKAASLSMTAAGLLTRQYLGCRKDDSELVAGCKYLAENLPPEGGTALGNIYYYHYATQVLHHMEGVEFDLWNYRMREHLIRTQQKEGCRAGSWNPQGVNWAERGGRLFATGLALMTLQVYYRHLPMYRPIVRTATGGGTLGEQVTEGANPE